jgi:copper chaperone CopZ
MQPNPSTPTSAGQPLKIAIDGMSCGHCIAAVSHALRELPGVTVEQIAIGSASVALDPRLASPQAVVAAVEEAGYGARVDGGTASPA